MAKPLMSMEELRKSGMITWAKSTPTLKKWVLRDRERRNILRAIYVKSEGSSKGRWYFKAEYVQEYVNAFHRGELDIGPRYE